MANKRTQSENLKNLYQDNDKLIIEDLKKRLHDQLSRNPAMAKKAAIIIENWIIKKPTR